MRRLALWVPGVLLLLTLSGCQTAPNPGDTARRAQEQRNDALLTSFLKQERAWAGLKTRKLSVGGHPLVFSEGGPADGPVILMLHGFSGSRDNWNRVARALTERYHLIIPDLPGNGDTPLAPDQPVTSVAIVELLTDLMDRLDVDHFSLAGHSLGGAYAIRMAATQSPRVDHLALIDSAGIYADNPSALMKQIDNGKNPLLIRGEEDLPRLLNLVMAEPPFIPRQLMRPMARRQMAHQEDYKRIFAEVREEQNHYTPKSFRRNLYFIHARVLLLWGEKDRIFPPVVLDEIQPHFRNARRKVLAGIGHIPMLEAPRETATAIRDFIAHP